jgi:hypothetical protein
VSVLHLDAVGRVGVLGEQRGNSETNWSYTNRKELLELILLVVSVLQLESNGTGGGAAREQRDQLILNQQKGIITIDTASCERFKLGSSGAGGVQRN